MAQTGRMGVDTRPMPQAVSGVGAHRAFQILHFGLTVAPIVAGLDKFFNILTDWDRYLAPSLAQGLHTTAYTFMRGVGIVEIIAGLIVAVKPRIGGYVVALWLLGIIANLAINPRSYLADPSQRYWDIALRDLGLMFAALALAWLANDPAANPTSPD